MEVFVHAGVNLGGLYYLLGCTGWGMIRFDMTAGLYEQMACGYVLHSLVL